MDDKLVERINAKADAMIAEARKKGKVNPNPTFSKPSPLQFIKTKEQAEIFMVLLKHDWQYLKEEENSK